MKKTLIFLLCTLFIFALISCAAEQQPEILPDVDFSESENYDMGGRKIVAAVVKDYFFEGEDNTLGYINNTVLADIAIKRIKDVETKFNIDLTNEYVTRAGEAAHLDAVSGLGQYDYIQEESYFLVEYLSAGIFVDLTSVDGLDYTDTEKWGTPYILESMMYDGELYGVYPASHPIIATNSACGVFCIDESIVAQLGAEDPRDIYERGEWTWDNFEKILPNYTSSDLISNQTVYSLATPLDFFLTIISNSNTRDHYIDNGNGLYTSNLYTDAGFDALNKAYEWAFITLNDNIKKIGSLEHAESIKRNDAAMYLMDSYDVLNSTESAAYLLENFGLVPAPVGPNLEPKTVVSYYNALDFTLCIPVSAKDVEASAMILDSLYEPFEDYDTREKVIEFLCRNYFSDSRDADVYLAFTDNMQYQYFSEKVANAVLDKITGSSVSVTRITEGSEDNVNKLIEKYVKTKKDTMKTLYD